MNFIARLKGITKYPRCLQLPDRKLGGQGRITHHIHANFQFGKNINHLLKIQLNKFRKRNNVRSNLSYFARFFALICACVLFSKFADANDMPVWKTSGNREIRVDT